MVATKDQKSKAVVFQGHYYATLDFALHDNTNKKNQQGQLLLPSGWDLAPNDEHIVASVISRHPWQCDALVFADGTSIYTSSGSKPGEIVGQDALQIKDCQISTKYAFGSCHRVLIRHAIVALQDFRASLLGMWEDRKFADCTVKSCGEEMSCHRVILASGSPVFEKMLSSNMREGLNNCIEIGDADPRHVWALLKALYTGRVDEEIDLSGLMILADRYECHSLAVACAESLVDTVDTDSLYEASKCLKSLRERSPFDALFGDLVKKVQGNSDLVRHALLNM